jgi:ribulose-5-phosphate 4-epimerase/fuculose-1-phosphate aldolase
VTIHADGDQLRATVANACRLLAAKGLVEGILGHVSARVGPDELVVRCRGEDEQGLRRTRVTDVWRLTLDGARVDLPEGYQPPKELPIHTELLRARPECGAVIHAHPRAALLAGLAELEPRPVFGAYNIPAMRLALEGIPVYPRPILITRPELARELVDAMGDRPVCLLRGHGITVAAESVEQATVIAVNLNELLEITVELARLGAHPPAVSERDLAELPDLGQGFNVGKAWQALLAELDEPV